MEFHVHIDASLLDVGAMLFQNVTRKSDQALVYASTLLNRIEQNYSTTHRKALAMVFSLHNLLGNKFVFYVDHMALVYLVNKPQVSRRIIRWLLLFLEYDFTIVYKPSRIHVVADALSRLPDNAKPIGVSNQTINASLFYIGHEWLNDVKEFLKIGQIESTLSMQQKQRLVRRVEPFTLKNGELYRLGKKKRL